MSYGGYQSQNSYGNNARPGGGYGGNSSYGGNNSYAQNSYGGQQQGYGSNQRGPSGYGGNSQNGQYGNNQQYGGNQQYGNNQQQYGGGYGGNGYGGYQQYGANQYQNQGPNGQYNQYGHYGPQPGQETEEDVNRVAQQIRDTRQETLQSTRNALRALQEADDSANRTVMQLGEQSEQLGRIERNLDAGQIHADNAQEKAGELKTVNRSMFAIHISNPFNSRKKQEAALALAKQKAAEEAEQRDRVRREEYDSKMRVNEAMGVGPYGRGAAPVHQQQQRPPNAERQMYSFENNAQDDADEDEIDQNLDLMGGLLGGLKNKATAMNVEVNRQNERMTGVIGKSDRLTGQVNHNTQLLHKISKS
ncbi:hypothetical protein BGZ73_007291 [Actinomortierella ambigua]|nr:hypothetical protein BGZ73_007291 [Actinomortierella ambigua]